MAQRALRSTFTAQVIGIGIEQPLDRENTKNRYELEYDRACEVRTHEVREGIRMTVECMDREHKYWGLAQRLLCAWKA